MSDQPLISLYQGLRDARQRHGNPDLGTRLAALDRLRTALVERQADLIAAIDADFGGRAEMETRLLEIAPLIGAIRHTRRNLKRWMRPESRKIELAFQPAKAWTQHQPLGVVGVLSPWNYPLLLSVGPLIDAIGAGNRVMIKPSERTPAFADQLQEVLGRAFSITEVAVVSGGPEVAQAFTALPFDHLVFTGSTDVGRKVMQAAAANLTPVTLELGGKSPVIVGPGADLERAARSIAFGKFLNAGQSCIAPDYVLAPRRDAEQLARAIARQAAALYPGVEGHGARTSLISPDHRRSLIRAIEDARAGGAVIFEGGSPTKGDLGPTVVLHPPAGSALMRDEIFGPVLPIIAYQDLADAVAFVNSAERPLALYVFSEDEAEQRSILDRTLSGGVTINGTMLHIAQHTLPFGGVGASGMGAYHGHAGFKRFSHERSVHKVGSYNGFERLGPPYGALARFVAAWLTDRR